MKSPGKRFIFLRTACLSCFVSTPYIFAKSGSYLITLPLIPSRQGRGNNGIPIQAGAEGGLTPTRLNSTSSSPECIQGGLSQAFQKGETGCWITCKHQFDPCFIFARTRPPCASSCTPGWGGGAGRAGLCGSRHIERERASYVYDFSDAQALRISSVWDLRSG
jgi:hypothetical protein